MNYDYEFDIKDLFTNSNNMADYVRTNSDGYRNYLTIAANCENYSVSNQLLIHGFGGGKKPVYLDDYSNWLNNGFKIKEDATIIHIMEKYSAVKEGYKDRMLVDVTDTNAQYQPIVYDKGIVLEALMISSPCRIEFNPEITSKAIYVPNKQIIEVSRGYKNIEQIFERLSMEMVHAAVHLGSLEQNKGKDDIKMQYPRAKYNFLAYSVSYMLASKYDMKPDQIEIKALPPEWKSTAYGNYDVSNFGRAFKNDVLKPLNEAFKQIDGILSNQIKSMYSQTGSEL